MHINQLIDNNTIRSASYIGIQFENNRITNEQLQRASDLLAQYIQSQTPDNAVIGVYLQPSPELIISIIAILKAQRTYLPLDIEDPANRTAFILKDSSTQYIITNSKHSHKITDTSKTQILLDQDWEKKLIPNKKKQPLIINDINHISCLFYISDETNKPKGVMIKNTSLMRYLESIKKNLALDKNDVYILLQPIISSASLFEILVPIVTGGRLIIPTENIYNDPNLLFRYIKENNISILQLTTTLLKKLLNVELLSTCQTLSKILIINDPIPEDILHQYFQQLSAKLFFLYGMEETTVHIACTEIDESKHDYSTYITNILPNTEIYLLNEEHIPVKPGQAGEIFVGGELIAQGYLNRSEANQKYFIKNPFSKTNSPDDILFKTGDMARSHDDGRIELLNKNPNQINIQGIRVELKQISTALKQHSDVEDSIVIPKINKYGFYDLIAYVIPNLNNMRVPMHISINYTNSDATIAVNIEDLSLGGICLTNVPATFNIGENIKVQLPNPIKNGFLELTGKILWKNYSRTGVSFEFKNNEQKELMQIYEYYRTLPDGSKLVCPTVLSHRNLRYALESKLPHYMIHKASVWMESFPKNQKNEVIYDLLPEPNLALREKHYIAPRNYIEKFLADNMYELLDIKIISVDDNFLEMGGDLFLTTRLAARINDKFNLHIELEHIFKNPTISSIAEYIKENLDSEKQISLHPISRDALMPLYYPEQRLWFLEKIKPHTTLYNVSYALYIKGNLNLDLLEKSLNIMVQRHENLRTIYIEKEGSPYRVILDSLSVELDIQRIESHATSLLHNTIKKLLHEHASRIFSLEKPPLFRMGLIIKNSLESYLIFTTHKIILDNLSIHLYFNELFKIYNCYINGESIDTTPSKIQYADFAVCQSEYFGSMRYNRDITYWQQQLKFPPTLVSFPSDFPRPALPDYNASTLFFTINPKLAFELKQLATDHHVTFFMLMMASFHILLHRYTGDIDILIGTSVPNRASKQTEKMLGYFVNTLVIRSTINNNPSFTEFLYHIRANMLAAVDHQKTPFELLIDSLKVERSVSHAPLVQIMFEYENEVDDIIVPSDMKLKKEYIEQNATWFDLIISLSANGSAVNVQMKYKTDLYKTQTIKKLFNHWEILLKSILQFPYGKISQFKIMHDDEIEYLKKELNATHHYYPIDKTIHKLFEEQVHKTSKQIAVRTANESLSYMELNHKANQLARYLRHKGCRTQTKVGVCIERDINLVVILLGILKTGGTYIPIDPNYPSERIEFILRDSRAEIIITQKSLPNIPNIGCQYIYYDEDINKINQEKKTNLELHLRSECASYIIYTSGSTGNPKGVVLRHRNAVNFLSWAQNVFTPEELKTVLASTSINFDLSIFELFVPIVSGGTVFITKSILQVEDWIRQPITLINSVPSLIKTVLELNVPIPASVTCINLAGEPLSNSLAQTLYALPQIKHIYNLYGPTETTTYSTISLVKKSEMENINIGKPLHNTQIYLLDSHLNLVPYGCVGEIYIAGDGVAIGYLEREDLTKERFLNNPFMKDSQELQKMYKTGDLGRYGEDGAIEYLGRTDFQVKLHGLRIELGEIENVIIKHKSVKEVVVLVREDITNEKRLVAYLTLTDTIASIDEIKKWVKVRLPDYMVPSVFSILEAFPLTPNGKIDRKALPIPDLNITHEKQLGPRNETEKKLVTIWEDLLHTQQISIFDNFFELGGDSLLVAKLAYRLRSNFNYDLSIVNFFSDPTIATLSSLLEQTKHKESDRSNVIALIEKDLKKARKLIPFNTKCEPANSPKHILLTGVSGFLGIYLLHDLIQKTDATVYCLIRRHKDKSIHTIFKENALFNQLPHLINNPRIRLFEGDLRKNKLGIDELKWNRFAKEIDTIFHAGAYVHHLFDYKTLRKTNVEGTIELLRLASEGRAKRFHYISTLWAIFDKEKDVLPESFPSKLPTGYEDGYGLTKWTSEKILAEAKDRGFIVTIFRPGFILGHSSTSIVTSTNLHILLLLKGCIQLGYAPKGLGKIDTMPVDYVSNYLVQITLQEENQNKVFNCSHPNPPQLDQVFRWLKVIDKNIKIIPFEEWRDNHVSHLIENNAMYPITTLYLTKEVPVISAASVESSNFKKALKHLHLKLPKINRYLFIRYFTFLEKWFLS